MIVKLVSADTSSSKMFVWSNVQMAIMLMPPVLLADFAPMDAPNAYLLQSALNVMMGPPSPMGSACLHMNAMMISLIARFASMIMSVLFVLRVSICLTVESACKYVLVLHMKIH